jgi:hypothetical protein
MRANKAIVLILLLLPAMFLGCGPNGGDAGGAITDPSPGTQSKGVVRQTPPHNHPWRQLRHRQRRMAMR